MFIRMLTAILIAATLTAPAHAAPEYHASASFVLDPDHLPPQVLEGEVDFDDTADGKTKIVGHFTRGFLDLDPEHYRWILVNDTGKVEVDLTADLRKIVEIAPPEVGPFELIHPAKVKDLLELDFVVYQIIKLDDGVVVHAETGRAPIKREPRA